MSYYLGDNKYELLSHSVTKFEEIYTLETTPFEKKMNHLLRQR